jgi:hypothetical protein
MPSSLRTGAWDKVESGSEISVDTTGNKMSRMDERDEKLKNEDVYRDAPMALASVPYP